jgi:L-alanine-DL-glutamate epimerase-like enolase superfamily enzyme
LPNTVPGPFSARFQDGEIQVPDLPGIGLDINEEAVQKFRVA